MLSVLLKVKYFVWLVLRDRVAVRDRLQKIGIIQAKENVCLIYNECKEDNRDIFVHCEGGVQDVGYDGKIMELELCRGRRCSYYI